MFSAIHPAGMAPPPRTKYTSYSRYAFATNDTGCVNCLLNIPDLIPAMPEYNEFITRIYEVLQPFVKPEVDLTEDSELVTELGLTSLQVMTLIEHIEDDLDISVPLNILPDIRTIRDLANQLIKLT